MVREFLRAWERRDTEYIVDHFADDVVMNERTDYITLNGRPVTLPICGVFEIENGRIKAWREYFDLAPAKAAYDTP